MPSPIISIRQLSKRFGKTTAVADITFDVYENEFFALLGPSGCGKTTLLRMIAGMEMPTSGELLLDGKDLTRMAPNQRPVNMVFQSYAVFPHMSVQDNVGYGLRVTGVPAAEIAPRAREALEMVRLDHLAQRMPDQLSGGQRQRVALARALVKRPRVLLLDEPLSALDAKLREQMQFELSRLQKAVGITFIIVTHDQAEALSMSDRIAVMNAGSLAQLASPQELYANPKSRFIADFIGKINLIDTQVTENHGGRIVVNLPDGRPVELAGKFPAGTPVSLAIRPEKLRLSRTRPVGNFIVLPGRVADSAYYGDSSHVYVEVEGGTRLGMTLREENRGEFEQLEIDDPVWVQWLPQDTMVLDK